jgi:hypothetical protein
MWFNPFSGVCASWPLSGILLDAYLGDTTPIYSDSSDTLPSTSFIQTRLETLSTAGWNQELDLSCHLSVISRPMGYENSCVPVCALSIESSDT